MAIPTVTIVDKNVTGKLRQHLISVTMGAGSGNVDTGLSKVIGFSLAPVSMATAGANLKRNVGSGATSRPGIINVNSAANGDDFMVVVYGV